MLSFGPLLSATYLAVAVSAALTNVVPPASRGVWNDPSNALILDGTLTDTQAIVDTAHTVDQKTGATGEPDQPVADTVVTAVDGQLTDVGIAIANSARHKSLEIRAPLKKRAADKYQLVFGGTGLNEHARDASIQGTAYLTFTLVSNTTYNVDACLDFCDSVKDCVFANLYYEFNNPGLDREFSNLKCAVYADTHTAAEKTNFGGQQLAPSPAGLTYAQHSGGWSSKTLVDPTTPDGYELVFGPTNGANNAPGYMGFAFLDRYDVDACAAQCNSRGADGNGGACQFFNIWRAVVNGNPTTYTCSMYYFVSDASTAVNFGQGDLKVTFSRGYKRTNYVGDGGFEGYAPSSCGDFCFSESYSKWIGTSPPGGALDATIFRFQPYAHFGNAVALLGSANGHDALPGTLSAAQPLSTVAGKRYIITFFHASAFSGPSLEADAFVDVLWNGHKALTIRPGFSNWHYYSAEVTAIGNDKLAFHGGKAPAWSFIDDVNVFLI